jgi:hypothetical protein
MMENETAKFENPDSFLRNSCLYPSCRSLSSSAVITASAAQAG